jgi:hypothetical protein
MIPEHLGVDDRYHQPRIRLAGTIWPRHHREITMKIKPVVIALMTVALTAPCMFVDAAAQDSAAQSATASEASLAASGVIVEGSAGIVRAGAKLVVAAVTPLSDATVIVLRDVASGSEASVRVAGDIAQAASVTVGTTISVVAEASGASLLVAGRLIAFVPNEVGRALVYQARSTQR